MKTSELTGVALDWAVAKCEEVNVRYSPPHEQLLVIGYEYMVWQPHKNWALGGPIIDREKIDLKFANDGEAEATLWVQLFGVPNSITEYGETPLIAAMRCFVKAKLGDEINLPAKLS